MRVEHEDHVVGRAVGAARRTARAVPCAASEQVRLAAPAPATERQAAVELLLVVDAHHPAVAASGHRMRPGEAGDGDVAAGAGARRRRATSRGRRRSPRRRRGRARRRWTGWRPSRGRCRTGSVPGSPWCEGRPCRRCPRRRSGSCPDRRRRRPGRCPTATIGAMSVENVSGEVMISSPGSRSRRSMARRKRGRAGVDHHAVLLGEQFGHPGLHGGHGRAEGEIARPQHLDDRLDLLFVVDPTGRGQLHGRTMPEMIDSIKLMTAADLRRGARWRPRGGGRRRRRGRPCSARPAGT